MCAMNRIVILVIAFLVIPSSSWATAQFPDLLIYKGKTEHIFTNPLEQYFRSQHHRPPKLLEASCSALWRGYVATWMIKKDKLYLLRVVEGTCEHGAPEIPISKIFPGKKPPVFASWYSGTLLIPQGKEINYVHMGYQSTYEHELHIMIKNGVVQGTKRVDNRKRN